MHDRFIHSIHEPILERSVDDDHACLDQYHWTGSITLLGTLMFQHELLHYYYFYYYYYYYYHYHLYYYFNIMTINDIPKSVGGGLYR